MNIKWSCKHKRVFSSLPSLLWGHIRPSLPRTQTQDFYFCPNFGFWLFSNGQFCKTKKMHPEIFKQTTKQTKYFSSICCWVEKPFSFAFTQECLHIWAVSIRAHFWRQKCWCVMNTSDLQNFKRCFTKSWARIKKYWRQYCVLKPCTWFFFGVIAKKQQKQTEFDLACTLWWPFFIKKLESFMVVLVVASFDLSVVFENRFWTRKKGGKFQQSPSLLK